MNGTVLARVFFGACLGMVLYSTFRLFAFSYFWLDDFNNLYWVQKLGGSTLWWDVVNPASHRFRPVGWFSYWVLWRFFDLAPIPYHVFAWMLHSLNVIWVYVLVRRMLQSEYAAAVGSLLFAFQAAYWDIYWSFGTIFELLAAFFFFLGVWIYLRWPDSLRAIWLATLIYVLAIKSKEMAITLPAIWLAYESLVKESWKQSTAYPLAETARGGFSRLRALAIQFSVPAAVGIWFAYLKTSTMAGMITTAPYTPDFPYYMSFAPGDVVNGYGWYLDALSNSHLGSVGWAAIAALSAGFLLVLRKRLPLFFLSYIFVSLLPVIVFPNHRFAFFWYIPFFGVSGLAAWSVKRIIGWMPWEMSRLPVRVGGALLFLVACYAHFHWQANRAEMPIQWAKGVSQEYRSFLEGLRTLPQPPLNETVYYNRAPQYFEDTTILTATQVAFRRTDLKAQIVPTFPPEAAYRVRFENGTVRVEPPETSAPPSALP